MKEDLLDDVFLEKIESLSDLTRWERLWAMIVDHFILSFLVVLIFVPPSFIFEEDGFQDYFFPIAFGLYFCKDTIKSRSIAKRILGQIVIDIKTGLPADELKCFIRNLTIPFYLIEVFFVLFNPKRRLGDLIAGTKVVRIEKKKWISIFSDFKEANKLKLIIAFLLSIGFCYLFLYIVFVLIGYYLVL